MPSLNSSYQGDSILAIREINQQQEEKMAFYMILDIEIKMKKVYSEYIEKVQHIVRKYGGKYLVRGGRVTPISNNWHPERIIVIEFQNKQQIQQCFQSKEYLDIAYLREQSSNARAIVVEGCDE